MSRLMTWQKATALVPLALLSGAWTASLAVTSTASASPSDGAKLPDGTSLPVDAVEAPASVSVPGVIAPGVPAGSANAIVASASANGIPSAALAAYQRAAQVINAADPSCHVDWTLIAAIGRVESDHGRYGGNTLSEDGVSSPGIYGIPLDGSNGTAAISDTDAGEIDNDPVFDRAVGPMQFIPSTWSVVGVDGDGDGIRNAQDIDDAALATAVYLCSGDEDLATTAGQRASVYRYNHSQQYVDLVLSIMRAYATGDYSAVPNGTTAPATFTPYYGDAVVSTGTRGFTPYRGGTSGGKAGANGSGGSGESDGSGADGSSSGSSDEGTEASGPITTDPGAPAGGGSDPTDAVKETVKKVTEPVETTISALDKAKLTCQENFNTEELDALGGLTACAQAVLDDGLAGVQDTLAKLLDVGEVLGDGGLGGLPLG